MNGVLVIDKPEGWTSHDVVARVRKVTGEQSVGHLGTLDPMATGVLPLLFGKMTRLTQFFARQDKEYAGAIRLGFATTTYDAEGDRAEPAQKALPPLEAVRLAAERFKGTFMQTPPPYSAKKIGGIPAYKLARNQKPVELKPVEVEVHTFDLVEMSGDTVRFTATVRGGTYIRSLAHDLGVILGTGGHLVRLRRTRSGEFGLKEAVTLERVEEFARAQRFPELLVPARHILRTMPSVTATDEQITRVQHGNTVNLAEFSQAQWIKVFSSSGELVAVASRVAGTLFQPKVVLAEQEGMRRAKGHLPEDSQV